MARILVVDDQRAIRAMFQKILKDEPYEVELCEDGEEAYKRAMSERYDLILTDLIMPKMDGIELTKALRKSSRYKHTPILIAGNNNAEEKKERGKEAGATGWLVKPISADMLLPQLRQLLE